MADLDRALAEYEKGLNDLLYDKNCCWVAKGENICRLARFIIDNFREPTNSRFKWFDSVLRNKFQGYSKSLADSVIDGTKTLEDIATVLLDYSIRFETIRDHTQDIDRNTDYHNGEPLEFFLKYLPVRELLEEEEMLLKCFRSACTCFTLGSKDCGFQISLVYQSIRDFGADIGPNGHRKVDFKYKILDTLTRMGFECLQENLLLNPDRDFSEMYELWQRTLKLLSFTGYSDADISGFETLFDGDANKLIQSLGGILLENDDLEALITIKRGCSYDIQLAYAKNRKVEFLDDNFDQLLHSILLLNYGTLAQELGPVREVQDDFLESLKDVKGFHTRLINYLDHSFKKNYDIMRRNPHTLSSQVQNLWPLAASILIEQYVPEAQIFLQRYVIESLIPQVLTLNSKFSWYYRHKNCLQRLWIEHLRENIPMKVEAHFLILDNLLNSLKTDLAHFHTHKVEMVKFYVSERIYAEVIPTSKDHETTIWPSSELKEKWNEEVQDFAKDKKVLKGLFNLHTVTMTSPFYLPNGRRPKILTTLTMASIIYLFNDYEYLDISEICSLLCTTETAAITGGLHKLKQCGIVIQGKNNIFKINNCFEPSKVVAKTGVIRCI